MTEYKCKNCGAPTRPMPPDGDIRYEPPKHEASRQPLLSQLAIAREASEWSKIEDLPKDKLLDAVFTAYFINRGDCCWVQLKRTLEQVNSMMIRPTHWMYVPSVALKSLSLDNPVEATKPEGRK